MKAVVYARSATRAQTPHGNSIQAPIEAFTKYAKENGFEMMDVFIDVGYSCLRLDRPGLDKMRGLIARDAIGAVEVSDVARLTCSAIHKSRLENEFADRRVKFHCVTRSVSAMTTRGFLA